MPLLRRALQHVDAGGADSPVVAGSVTGSSIGSCASAARRRRPAARVRDRWSRTRGSSEHPTLVEPVRVVENLRWLQSFEQFARLPDGEPEPGHDPQLAVARVVSDQPLPRLAREATHESVAVLADRPPELRPRVGAPVWKAVEHTAREERRRARARRRRASAPSRDTGRARATPQRADRRATWRPPPRGRRLRPEEIDNAGEFGKRGDRSVMAHQLGHVGELVEVLGGVRAMNGSRSRPEGPGRRAARGTATGSRRGCRVGSSARRPAPT